jgi:OmpA-OmpF porin, OOP family
MNFTFTKTLILSLFVTVAFAQQKTNSSPVDNVSITNADLGKFPYFKKLPGFEIRNSSDSIFIETNEVYCYDGKKLFTVVGKVYKNTYSFNTETGRRVSEFQIINEYDKIIRALGGQRIHDRINLQDLLLKEKKLDIVDLAAANQIVGSAYYGIISYLIKTKDKEIYVQLQPYTIGSNFYNLLVVEKNVEPVKLNTNKENLILKDLNANKTAIVKINFEPDLDIILSDSKDEILNILGVFQANKSWTLSVDVHNASLGKPEDNQTLCQKRADAIKAELVALGINPNQIKANGIGDKKPLVGNETEVGRLKNTRIEIRKL